ncbi:SGNH/GDSL hydrolase family protein [Aspergillus foveolatus]|uniref:SGNH/GDSL hydrolase family protein n=1 Tax=Aspergillus foveolatus TaxID=210207 RepID=UPI003CCD91BB
MSCSAVGIMKFTKLVAACALWIATVAGKPIHWQDSFHRHWLATWTAMPQEVESANLPSSPFGGADADFQFKNATLRQTVRVSVGAERVRFQFSNRFGLSELPITAASVALPEGGNAGVGEIDTSTIQSLTFNGDNSITIPPQETVYSDPIDFNIPPLTNLAISIYSAEGQAKANITGHPGSRTTSWMETGNRVDASSITEASLVHWYFISAVEAWAPRYTSGLVILGDSITDGRGSDDNENNRWPDALAERLQRSNLGHIAVNNEAAGGNAILAGGLGPPLLDRYYRDALGQKGVEYVMIFEGVNDIGVSDPDTETQNQLFDSLIDAYSRIIRDCKDVGLTTIGATITPFGGSQYADPSRERTRLRINEWILKHSPFDHTVDFSSFIGDGDQLRAEFDSGDHLHPNVAAYKELARRVDLKIFWY